MDAIRIVLVGIGGYAENYVDVLLGPDPVGRLAGVAVVGVVDPYPEKCQKLSLIAARNIPIYPNLDTFYGAQTADLAVISTPIHLHVEQILACLAHGSHVLCEKPLCAVYQDANRLLAAEKASGKMVGIGFQLSYSNAVQELKKDILAGSFGRAVQFKSVLLQPRGEQYYQRNNWAGKLKTTQGHWVLDSPVSNACAHQLHNMLYLLGATRETSAIPVELTAECYRAYPLIENYDTAAIRCTTTAGTELLFYTSLAYQGAKKYGPYSEYRFEHAVVYHDHGNDENFWVRRDDGTIKNYGELPKSDRLQKLWDALNAVRDGKPPACGIQAALSHLLCANGAQEAREIEPLPQSTIAVAGEPGNLTVYIPEIAEMFMDCYQQAKLPHEIGVPWSKPGRSIDLTHYERYPQFS